MCKNQIFSSVKFLNLEKSLPALLFRPLQITHTISNAQTNHIGLFTNLYTIIEYDLARFGRVYLLRLACRKWVSATVGPEFFHFGLDPHLPTAVTTSSHIQMTSGFDRRVLGTKY